MSKCTKEDECDRCWLLGDTPLIAAKCWREDEKKEREMACNCEFDPSFADEGEESWHYRRVCSVCLHEWAALHCPHDGVQRPCPKCDQLPVREADSEK